MLSATYVTLSQQSTHFWALGEKVQVLVLNSHIFFFIFFLVTYSFAKPTYISFLIINIILNNRRKILIVSNETPDIYFPIYLIHIQTYIVSSGSGFAPDNSRISIIHQYLVIYILQKSPTQRQKCDENQLSTLFLVPFGCHLPTVLHFPRPEDSCY